MKIIKKAKKKKNVIIGGAMLVILGVGISLLYKQRNSKNPLEIFDDFLLGNEKIELNPKIINISSHIRSLPTGINPSIVKVNTALENGFVLSEGETWVIDYTKQVI